MNLPETFRTRRLLLTRFFAADAPALEQMRRDMVVAGALCAAHIEAGAQRLAMELSAHWDRHGFGRWALREPGSARFIGCGGPSYVELRGEPEIEVGVALMPGVWGRGLAEELVRVAVAQAIVRLGAAGVVGVTPHGDAASRRVLEKTGFACKGEIIHVGKPHMLFRLAASDWCAGGATRTGLPAAAAAAEEAFAA